jgi:hypothetical protein
LVNISRLGTTYFVCQELGHTHNAVLCDVSLCDLEVNLGIYIH